MKTLLAFDNDGVLRDESVSYQRCIVETVAFFNQNIPATEQELAESMKQSNDDWERTHKILQQRGVIVDFETVKERFQDLYLGEQRDFKGYINDEPWLADNNLLAELAKNYPLVIISGAPKEEILHTLRKNQAIDFFAHVWGMFDCDGKKDGLERAITDFTPEQVFFCDDRPSPLKETRKIKGVHVYGIMPPQKMNDWYRVLKEAGAKEVFPNVKEYCQFLIDCGCKINKI